MKRTIEEVMDSYYADLPRKSLYGFVRFFIKSIVLRRNPKYVYHFDKAKMQDRQVIVLSDHSATDSWLYVLNGYPFTRLNFVVGYKHFYKKAIHYFLKGMGCIPKRLYETDFHSVGQMLSVLEKGGSLCLFPEGIQSYSGSDLPIHPATATFLKQIGKTVVLCKGFGAYLTYPLYSDRHRRGHIEYHFEILFTSEELKHYDTDEIYKRLLDRFRYNDFEWNNNYHYKYKSRVNNGEGLQNLLYLCPICGKEYTLSFDKGRFACRHCGNSVYLDSAYNIHPVGDSSLPYRNIDEWYKAQRSAVRETIKHTNITLEYDCQVWGLHSDKLRFDPYCICGNGHICINEKGIFYKGTYCGEKAELFFDIRWVSSFACDIGLGNELYYQGVFYLFKPIGNVQKCIKYMLLVEEYHNLIDEKWNRVSRDAYGF